MSGQITVDVAERELRGVLESLQPGDAVRLVDEKGDPVAVIVSVKPKTEDAPPASSWRARLDALGKRVSREWKSEKSAVEIVSEMRR